VKCILRQATDTKNSWCGKLIALEWAFNSIDHAAFNALGNGRLVACPDCVKAINDVLTSRAQ
jgi:NifU-like protein involved in Fe-S cluster formation